MGLREYKAKRDFKKTAEPKPKRQSSRGAPLFVIQKHDASRLHYDFRLELDGVLKSWAVPKGIPFEKGDKRLAMHVEDHPLSYARFEGIIPEGQYGGGTVMVWDIGTWEPLGGDPLHDLNAGKLHFALHGKKLEGEWTLVAMRHANEENAWLLLKSGESMRAVAKKHDDESVLTGRTMRQIAKDHDAKWESHAANSKQSHVQPRFYAPMAAKMVKTPPVGRDWIYEIKFDGYRALALKRGAHVELLSRNEKSFTAKFPEIVRALKELRCRDAVLDGEIVALDEKGRSSFQLMQARDIDEKHPPLCYYVFDLLNLDGNDVRGELLEQRKAQVEQLLPASGELRFSASLEGDVTKLLSDVKRLGLEGIIGKRRDSAYESGRRSGAWVKLKVTNEQEFVVGGYTVPQGSRHYFGALLVGFYEKEKLLFASKVGTGFSEKLLRELYQKVQPLRRDKCPFTNLPAAREGRWGQGITRAEMERCTWVKPHLVAQVRFTEWTRNGGLRHPAFLGMRQDKAAREVVREI